MLPKAIQQCNIVSVRPKILQCVVSVPAGIEFLTSCGCIRKRHAQKHQLNVLCAGAAAAALHNRLLCRSDAAVHSLPEAHDGCQEHRCGGSHCPLAGGRCPRRRSGAQWMPYEAHTFSRVSIMMGCIGVPGSRLYRQRFNLLTHCGLSVRLTVPCARCRRVGSVVHMPSVFLLALYKNTFAQGIQQHRCMHQ